MKITDAPVIVEQILHTSINDVWDAITNVERMKQWFFVNIESFRPEVGFETQFKVQVADRIFTHQWKLTEVIPYNKITYNWKYKEYPGDSLVTFELIQWQGHAKIRLTTKVLENFPAEIPEFSRKSCLGGWNYFIKKNLKEYLKANPN